jgi:hypothetical protein
MSPARTDDDVLFMLGQIDAKLDSLLETKKEHEEALSKAKDATWQLRIAVGAIATTLAAHLGAPGLGAAVVNFLGVAGVPGGH